MFFFCLLLCFQNVHIRISARYIIRSRIVKSRSVQVVAESLFAIVPTESVLTEKDCMTTNLDLDIERDLDQHEKYELREVLTLSGRNLPSIAWPNAA